MATWIAHLRIAEQVLKSFDFHKNGFVAGNIAPDCGLANEDWSAFDPPKKTTHWLRASGPHQSKINGNYIDAQAYYLEHVDPQVFNIHDEKFAFLMGYYVHLLTDIKWSENHREKKNNDPDYHQRLRDDPDFIWEVKLDWYGLDFLYLQDKTNNIFTSVFCNLESVEDYLPYFPKGAFNKQFDYIKNYYTSGEIVDKSSGRYLTKQEMDDFISATSTFICDQIRLKFKA